MEMHRLRVVLGEQLDNFVNGAEFVAGDGVENVKFIGGVEDAVEAAAHDGKVHDIGYRRAGDEDIDKELSGKVLEVHLKPISGTSLCIGCCIGLTLHSVLRCPVSLDVVVVIQSRFTQHSQSKKNRQNR